MTPEQQTPASVVERLNTLWLELNDAHAELPATARVLNTLAAAKDAVERLSAEREGLREALRPFALAADNMDGDEPDTLFIYDSPESAMIDYADLRRARAALTQGESRQTGEAGWQDIATAPKDRTPILAAIHEDLYPRVCPGRPDLERWNGQRVVIHHPGLCEDGFDIGWSVSAPVGCGLGTGDWFAGWQPLPAAPTPADGGGE